MTASKGPTLGTALPPCLSTWVVYYHTLSMDFSNVAHTCLILTAFQVLCHVRTHGTLLA